VVDIRHHILGKGTVDSVPTELGVLTICATSRLVCFQTNPDGVEVLTHLVALAAELAVKTAVGQPLDPDPVSHLDGGGYGAVTYRYNLTDSLVTAYEWGHGSNRPVTLPSVKIGVTDTGVGHLDETFARVEVLGLRDRVILSDLESNAGCRDNRGGLGRGDGEAIRRHVDGIHVYD